MDIKRDISKVVSLLLAVQGLHGVEPEWVLAFRHDGQPKPKGRPRLYYSERQQRTRVHTPEQTEIAETALAWRWKLALKGDTHEGSLALAAIFYRATHQRIDVDNMLKLVLDAGTQARAWLDDCQIVTIIGRTEYDKADPRTEVALMPTVSTMDKAKIIERTCEECGAEFKLTSRARYHDDPNVGRFCKRACARRWQAKQGISDETRQRMSDAQKRSKTKPETIE